MHVGASLFVLATLFLGRTIADPVAQASPQQTIVPFSTLPACAAKCGPLYDVQGACSPPTLADTSKSTSCFCGDARLTAFNTGTAGPCDNAGCPAADLTKIQSWYKGLCSGSKAATGVTTTSSTTKGGSTPTGTSSGSTSTSGASKSNSGGTWLDTHWKWVIMIVVIAVAIIGGWIGAALWRKRYLRRKEREFELRPPQKPWVGGGAQNHTPYGEGAEDKEPKARGGLLGAVTSGKMKKGKGKGDEMVYGNEEVREKDAGKKKWVVTERT